MDQTKNKKLIIIRGNSGSGKTTVAKALRHILGHNIMLLSQDVVRRKILRVKDRADTLALPLMQELLEYGWKYCDIVIVEGILRYEWYKPLFEKALQLYGRNNILAYYYDLSFEETLLRHQMRPSKSDFGEKEMREWWKEKDYMDIITEQRLTQEKSVDYVTDLICKDIKDYSR